MANLERTRKPGKGVARLGLALALLAGLGPLPAWAQAPETPPALPAAPTPPTPVPGVGVGMPPDGAPVAGPDEPLAGPVTGPLGWSFYATTGPIFPVAGGFQDRLDMGWTTQVGAREALTCPGPFMLFAEFAGEYTTQPARKGQVESTDVIASLSTGPGMVLSGFNRTEFRELQHLGFHGGLGWTYTPTWFDALSSGMLPADSRLFLIGRVGADGGATHAIFRESSTVTGRNDLIAFEVEQGNAAGTHPTRFTDLVRSHNPYFGFYATLGVGMTWNNLAVSAEVQLGYQWDDLGQFEPEATALTVSPLLTLSYSF